MLLLGFGCLLASLQVSTDLYKVEGKKPAAWFVLGAGLLIGGGLIALGARWVGWWGQ